MVAVLTKPFGESSTQERIPSGHERSGSHLGDEEQKKSLTVFSTTSHRSRKQRQIYVSSVEWPI